jgi:hypothetical protein
MNYVDDAWMKEFTQGQKTRIWAQIGMFRTGLIPVRRVREAANAANVVW